MTHFIATNPCTKALLLSASMLVLGTMPVVAGDLIAGWETSASVTLRGGLEHKNGKSEHFIVAAPEVEFSRVEDDLNSRLRLSTEIDQQATRQVAPRKLGLEGEIGMRLSANSGIEGRLSYDLSQARPSIVTLPTDVAQEGHAQSLVGSGEYTQRFGKAIVALRGGFLRVQTGNDLLANGTYASSADRNYWQAGVGGRVSYELTPRIMAFIDAQLARQFYDAASSSLLVKRDNWQSELRVGLGYDFNNKIRAEVSAGVLRQDYADASITDLQANTYDMAVTWVPWETSSIGLSYGTEINPTTRTGEVMEITDTARLTFDQRLNASWAANTYISLARQQYRSTNVEVKKSGIGFGVTYQANTDLSAFANYGFELTEETAKTPEKVHKIEAGFRFTRP